MNLKVLFLMDSMRAITDGGSERQILQLIHFLRENGELAELALLRNTRWLTEKQAGCPITFWDVQSLSSASGIRKLAALRHWIRSRQFDVVLTMFWEANLVGPILARLAGVPVVIGCRRNLNYWMSGTTAHLQRVSNLFASRLFANCEAVKAVVARM